MSWQCPECGEINNDDNIVVCFCGYNCNELPGEDLASVSEAIDEIQAPPGHSKKVLWKIFKFLFVVHLVAWSVVMVKQTIGRPYVLARAVMTNAVVLTGFYIRPLQKVLGPKNPLLNPLIGTRDFVFDIAWDLFPDDDADREFYWYMIYGNRGELLHTIHSYSRKKEENRFSDQEYEDYFSQMNEHMAGLALLPMNDSKNRLDRYGYFGVSAKLYQVMYGIYLARKNGVDYYLEPGSEYMKNIREQFDLFLQVREITKIDSPKTYESFRNRNDDWWYPMQLYILGATNKIIHTDVMAEQFECSSSAVVEFLQSRNKIILYGPVDKYADNAIDAKSYISNGIYLSSNLFSKGTTFKLLKEKCNTPAVQSFAEYPQAGDETEKVSN